MGALKVTVRQWFVGDRLLGQRLVSAFAWLVNGRGNRNPGWYGSEVSPAITGSWRQLRPASLRRAAVSFSRQLDYCGDQIFTNQVWRSIARQAGTELRSLRMPDDPTLVMCDRYLERLRPSAPPSASLSSFSIVTPYFRHFAYFRDCARSIARAMRKSVPLEVEWVVVNDDPGTSSDELRSAVPAEILGRTRIIENRTNIGNTATLNTGIAASGNEWIVFVDCDDVIAPRSLNVLSRYVARYPRCRYFSSSIVDIDDAGRWLRFRPRDGKATQLFTEGMIAGHLKAVRRDAFDDLGLLDVSVDGCQDYEFALRTAMTEPICFVPEFLYGYRWHTQTQSLSGLERQLSRAREIRQAYVERIKERCAGARSDLQAAVSVEPSFDNVTRMGRS